MARHSRPPSKQRQKTPKLPGIGRASFARHNLALSSLYLGEIDSGDELDTAKKVESKPFFSSFTMPPGVKMDALVDGKKFFIHGHKGAGKTSMLRYLGLSLEQTPTEIAKTISVVRFRKDFPNETLRRYKSTFLGSHKGKQLSPDELVSSIDYEDYWIVYLIGKVVTLVPDSDAKFPFKQDGEFKKLKLMLAVVGLGEKSASVLSFMPGLSISSVNLKGIIEIAADPNQEPGVNEDIAFSHFARLLLDQYKRLTAIPTSRVYILLDEIEPRIGSGLDFEFDLIIIRDLIAAIREINIAFPADKKSAFIVAAVRSEVADRAASKGKEVRKRLESLGYSMVWSDRGKADLQHPLISMICKKIKVSEAMSGMTELLPESDTNDQIWRRYFRKNVKEMLSPNYLLDLTWYRPRDLVRLLRLCADQFSQKDHFSEGMLASSLKLYCSQSWEEIEYYLALLFSPHVVDAIKVVLHGLPREFSIADLESSILRNSAYNSNVEYLMNNVKSGNLLASLYETGAIGFKSGVRLGYVHWGDTELQFTDRYVIHRALHPMFRPKRIEGRKR